LHPSKALFLRAPSKLSTLVLRILAALKLVEITVNTQTGQIYETTNLTILNWFLLRLGPMREKRLTQVLVTTQIIGSALAFFVRYGLAGLVYDGDRR
jgi:UDP-N-acetylglucosamine--dolichyl-phosphate N-acetylglucosaminephosphotransferase